jgi:error-prone DNA polymerase
MRITIEHLAEPDLLFHNGKRGIEPRRSLTGIHIICDRITDQDDMLRSIGRTNFTVAPGRGDGATSGGGPDPRSPSFPRGRTLASPPFGTSNEQEEILRVRSHDFH